MDGIINIDKPSGMTSSNVVVAVRRKLGVKAVGHMGTLDPIGSGVLLIGVGKGTRLFDYFLKKEKTYLAEFEFGPEYDTLDNTGKILRTTDVLPDIESIRSVLPSFIGAQLQMPPQFSAKSVGGRRAYDMAREGITVDLKPSEITVHSITCLSETAPDTYLFEIECSSGTYIRSICRDIAYKLGSLASMTSIRRTKCGVFTAENAVPLDNLSPQNIVPLENVISLPKYTAGDEDYLRLCNGIRLQKSDLPEGKFALYCRGELFGIAENEGGIKIKTYLRNS